MIARTVAQIAEMTNASYDFAWGDAPVRGVSIDSRAVEPGNIYIPIVGERFNGHDFAQQAVERGAAAVLWRRGEPNAPERFPVLLVDDTLAAIQRLAAAYRRQLRTRIVGITGSNGKTSTKDILAAVLGVKYKTQKTPGNYNNHLGVPLTLLGLEEDTEFAVVEMGMSGLGEIRQLAALAGPEIAIITSVSEVHLGDLHTRERIMQAKLEITESLRAEHLLIYHGDHAPLRAAVESLRLPCPQVTFGALPTNRLCADDIRIAREGAAFKVAGTPFELPLPGKHQVMNALAAIAAARHIGLSDEEIRRGLRDVRLTGLRTEWIEAGGLSIINDAYKSNPTSVRAALDLLYALKPYERKLVVLGDMVELGEESDELHRQIGEELRPGQIDAVFTIGPSARLIAEAARARFEPERVVACMDREELLQALRREVGHAEETGGGTLMLIKGSRSLELERVAAALTEGAAR